MLTETLGEDSPTYDISSREFNYDEEGRIRTRRGTPRKVNRKPLAIIAGILILLSGIFILSIGVLASILFLSLPKGTGVMLIIFPTSFYFFFAFAGIAGGLCAIKRKHGLIAVVGAVLTAFIVPFLSGPAIVLLYLSRDEF